MTTDTDDIAPTRAAIVTRWRETLDALELAVHGAAAYDAGSRGNLAPQR